MCSWLCPDIRMTHEFPGNCSWSFSVRSRQWFCSGFPRMISETKRKESFRSYYVDCFGTDRIRRIRPIRIIRFRQWRLQWRLQLLFSAFLNILGAAQRPGSCCSLRCSAFSAVLSTSRRCPASRLQLSAAIAARTSPATTPFRRSNRSRERGRNPRCREWCTPPHVRSPWPGLSRPSQ